MEEPTDEEQEAALDILANLDPAAMSEFRDAMEKSATAEEFVNRILVGDCPKCGSSNTGDCEHDPEIEDPCVARCFECGQLWCPDCGVFFTNDFADHDCPAWEDMDLDFDDSQLDDLD
jgi:hypothetical protein